MNVDKVCKFIHNNLFLIAPNIKIACVNKDTTDHFHNCLKSVKIISLDIGICRIGREVLTCCAIGWASEWCVELTSVWRAAEPACQQLIHCAQLSYTITSQIRDSDQVSQSLHYFSFQNYDLMSEF